MLMDADDWNIEEVVWERCSYLAFDINISIFIKQSSDDLHMTSSDGSDKHSITTLRHKQAQDEWEFQDAWNTNTQG